MNCRLCKFKEDKGGGHCYMWEKRPGDCHYFKAKKEPLEVYENTAADDYLDYLSDRW